MFENIENLKLLDIIEGKSVQKGVYTDRASHVLIFKLSGTSVYFFQTGSITLDAGQILFLPSGSSYRVEKISRGESRYVLMNFEGDMQRAVPRLYDADGFADEGLIRSGLGRMWLLGGAAEHYRCLSVFYHALSFVAKLENARYSDIRRLDVIRPGVERLRERIFDPELKVGQLHRLCGVSDTYFRALFKGNFGVGVQQYVTNKRLSQAAAILSGGDFGSVAEVARSVGYADPLYFSRAFTRRYGTNPSAYARTGRE